MRLGYLSNRKPPDQHADRKLRLGVTDIQQANEILWLSRRLFCLIKVTTHRPLHWCKLLIYWRQKQVVLLTEL